MGKGKSFKNLLHCEEEVHGVDGARENLFGLIEWAIETAASDYPVEFRFNRDNIAKLLFNVPKEESKRGSFHGGGVSCKDQKIGDISTVGKEEEEEVPPQHIIANANTDLVHVKEDMEGKKISNREVGNRPCLGLDRETAERLKFEEGKSELRQGYEGGSFYEDVSCMDQKIGDIFTIGKDEENLVQAQQNMNTKKISNCEPGNRPCLGLAREAEPLKLEASKRKLRQGYQQDLERKHSKKIQMIELNDLPPFEPPSSCKKGPRQRPAAAVPRSSLIAEKRTKGLLWRFVCVADYISGGCC